MESFAAYLENRISAASANAYMQDVRLYVAYLSMPPEKSTISDIEGYLTHLKNNGRAVATLRRTLSALSAYYAYLIKSGLCTENPAISIPKPETDKKIPVILTEEEVHRLLTAPIGHDPMAIRDRAMLELLYATGITVSELLSLNMDSVNLRRRMLSLSLRGKKRAVPFGRPASQALGEYIRQIRPLTLAGKNESALFLNYNGKRLSRQGVWKLVKKYKAIAGIDKEITPHMLRHSFAAHLLEHGADLGAIGEMMGFSDPASLKIYPKILENKIVDIYTKAHPRA